MSFSPKERDQELCRNIVEAFGFIDRYSEGLNLKTFMMDPKNQDAVTMRLQQMLESVSKLSPGYKEKLKIDWPSRITMRNKISHSYIDFDAEIVW